MGKPGAQHQKEYLARFKGKYPEEYLKKERKRKNTHLKNLKKSQNGEKYEQHLKKNRQRKKLARAKKKVEELLSLCITFKR